MLTSKIFIYFVTACGCAKMEPVLGVWDTPPIITIPLVFPTEIHDWINPPTDDSITAPISKTRDFRLEQEDLLPGTKTRIFTYREVMG